VKPAQREELEMSTGARRERVVVTHVAGRIGDHNDRAMAASPPMR